MLLRHASPPNLLVSVVDLLQDSLGVLRAVVLDRFEISYTDLVVRFSFLGTRDRHVRLGLCLGED
jgi:hypothetical protein